MKGNLREKSGLAMDSQQPRLADQPAAELAHPRGLSGKVTEEADRITDRHHFCRGCGAPLPPGTKRLFHPSCLVEDKRRRTRERRRVEQEKMNAKLRQLSCPRCGWKYGAATELAIGVTEVSNKDNK
jgi:hypothetical protein